VSVTSWQAEIDAIKSDPAWKDGDYVSNPARAARYELANLIVTTPDYASGGDGRGRHDRIGRETSVPRQLFAKERTGEPVS
jgi:hypothetical protein